MNERMVLIPKNEYESLKKYSLKAAVEDGNTIKGSNAGIEALRRAMWEVGSTSNDITRYTADAVAEKLVREAR